MTDDLLTEIASLGWLLNNCYQTDSGDFRVNLRRPDPDSQGDWFTDWAIAPTLAEALEDCMIKMIDAEFTEAPEAKGAIEPTEAGKSLLERLGLTKPRVTVERRI